MDELITERQNALDAAAALEAVAQTERRAFTADEQAKHAGYLANASAIKDTIAARVAADAERRAELPQMLAAATSQDDPAPAAGAPEVTPRDPGHYRPNGPTSFFRDMLDVRMRQDAGGHAAARLAEQSAYERTVTDIPQAGLTSTSAGGGQELVPPGHLRNLFVERAVAQSVLAGLVNVLPLEDGVRTVTIPAMTGDASVDEHTEGSDADSTDPTTDDYTATVYQMVGVVDASLYVRERSNPNIDAIMMRHFAKLQAAKIDSRIAAGSGTGQATGVLNVSSTNTATLSSDGDLSAAFPKIADVVSQIEDGAYNSPTAIAVCARRWGAWAAELDSTGRPLMVPAGAGAVNPTAAAEGNPTPAAAGFSGYTIQGIPVYKVPAIPKTLGGSTNQDAILVCDWSEFYLWLAGIVFDVSEHADFKKAGVSFRSRQYYAFLADHAPEAIGKITGAGLIAPTF